MGEDFNPKVAIFGDLGLKNAVSLPYLRKEVHSKAIDLIIHAGDIAYDLDDVKTHKNEFQTYFSTSFLPFFQDAGYVGDHFMERIESIGWMIMLHFLIFQMLRS